MIAFYIHIPFCLSRCFYCDFVSGIYPKREIESRYLQSLLSEMESLSHYNREALSSVYFGGGTPSLFPVENLRILLEKLRRLFKFHSEIEITLEANPEDVSSDLSLKWKKIGINRISLGFQSMEKTVLKKLGRRNTPESNLQAYEFLKQAGFNNISLDFILSVQGENLDENLKTIHKLKPQHISAYLLSIEKNTSLEKQVADGNYSPKNDEDSAKAYFYFRKKLTEMGYQQYEISNFALAGFQSRHNLNYWKRGEYFAVGIGASGYLKDPKKGAFGFRWEQTSRLSDYLEAKDFESLYQYREILNRKTALKESIMLGLRQTQGISVSQFRTLYQISLPDVLRSLPSEIKDFVEIKKGFFRLKPKGLILANQVIQAVWEITESDQMQS